MFLTKKFSAFLILLVTFFPALPQDTNAVQSAAAKPEVTGLASSASSKDTISLLDSISCYTVLVTASRRAQASETVTDDHQVIDVESAGRNTSKTPVELLNDNIPAWITDYGSGAVKTLSLRGAGADRTLILVNGVRLASTGIDAGGDLGNIPPEIIQRMEIVEGGQSALYGMDAMGGVINIITRQPQSDKVTGSFTSTLGVYEPENSRRGIDTKAYDVSLGQKVGGFEWFTGAGATLSDGAFPYKNATGTWVTRGSDGADECNFYQRLAYSHNDLSLGVTGSYAYRADEGPGAVTYPDPATTFQNSGSLSLDGSWVQSKLLTLKLTSSISQDSLHYVDTNAFTRTDSKNTWNVDNCEFMQDFTFGNQKITTGVLALSHSVISNNINYHFENQYAVYGSGIFELPAGDFTFGATPGVRLDNSSFFDNQVNGKIGASLSRKGCLKPMAFFNAGSAYHNPEFKDLFWPQDAYTVGNPDLKPEHSRDWDAGFQLQQKTDEVECTARCSYFVMRLDDMIVWGPRPDYVWTPVNVDKATIKGATFRGTIDIAKCYSGSINFTQSDARDGQTGRMLIYRPEYLATSSHTFTCKRFSVGIAGRYTGRVYTNDLNSASLPPCVTFDGNASVLLLKAGNDGDMRLIYDMVNMTNRQHSTIDGYPLPGREHRLSLRINF